MNIRDIRGLKTQAARQLGSASQAQTLVLIYGGITVALSALVTVVNYCLSLQISQYGGLSYIGLRSVLSTVQTVLPMAQWVVLLCLELGYLNAMLRVSRGQYASPNALRMGIHRFWPLLRCTLMQGAIYIGTLILAMYLSVQIFLITPWARPVMEIVSGMMGGLNASMNIDATMMLDEATYAAFSNAMLPMIPIALVVCLALIAPVFYRYRLVNYLLVDNPSLGAMALLRQSRMLMKRNRLALFRLDVSLWWYYLLNLLATAVAYGDVLLPMAGISLPFSNTVAYFLFYGVYLVLQLGLMYLFLNRISVTYALAYQSLLPEEPKDTGVVLGNIFQM